MSIHEILKKYWHYDTFRPAQEDIINAALARRDTLVLLPTGGGKSLCFQVPALVLEGLCVVITPLVALMKDQVEQLKRRGISAVGIHAGMHHREIDSVLDNCIYGHTKFLYLSPERLRSELLLARVKQMKICLLVVDEAHCVSQWGHDFRPSYAQIAEFHDFINHQTPAQRVPLMALTASATRAVRADIEQQLAMQRVAIFQQTFGRANLSYSAFLDENKPARLLRILQNVAGSAVVYARSRRRTKELSDWLNRAGVVANFYHAGLTAKERSARQDAWVQNRVRVMVATNAFGMGIDKPDVRVVVHIDLPENLEAYYQEAGRAGRDGHRAYAVALYTKADLLDLQQNVLQKYPPVELLRRVYQALANYFRLPVGGGELVSFDFDLAEFCHYFNLPLNETHYALKRLEAEGFMQLSDSFDAPSKMVILVDNRQLYDFQLKNLKYDVFLKLILRIYGGELFTNFTNISESQIGKSFYCSAAEVGQMLQFLHQSKVIFYDPQKTKPQLTYLTPRYDAGFLPINVFGMEQKKERELFKMRAVSQYVQHQTRCRTQLILAYFDENTDEECGVCDNCRAKNRADAPNKQADLIQAEILKELKIQALSPSALAEKLPQFALEAVVMELKNLLTTQRVAYNEWGLLRQNPTT